MAQDEKTTAEGKQGINTDKVGPGHPPKDKQWKPGQCGNPKGRPRSKPMTDMLKAMLDADDGAEMKAILKSAIKGAKGGDFRYAKEILDRSDGKVADKVEHKGEFGIMAQLLDSRKGEPDEQLTRAAETLGIEIDGTPGGSVDDSQP